MVRLTGKRFTQPREQLTTQKKSMASPPSNGHQEGVAEGLTRSVQYFGRHKRLAGMSHLRKRLQQ
jgi:hypothetical protein